MSIVIADEKRVLYWGVWNRPGHFLHELDGRTVYYPKQAIPGFSWDEGLLDTGLLKNGRHEDVEDGRVFWTCGGTPLWLAFFWWDRSGDRRGNSNSGFYVQGFDHTEPQAALDFACQRFPHIITRQRCPLVLQ